MAAPGQDMHSMQMAAAMAQAMQVGRVGVAGEGWRCGAWALAARVSHAAGQSPTHFPSVMAWRGCASQLHCQAVPLLRLSLRRDLSCSESAPCHDLASPLLPRAPPQVNGGMLGAAGLGIPALEHKMEGADPAAVAAAAAAAAAAAGVDASAVQQQQQGQQAVPGA